MLEDNELEYAIESVLFVSTDAITSKKLAEIFERKEKDIVEVLEGLENRYETADSGIILKQIAGG